MRTRIKICCNTQPEDTLKAVELGADAIGLIFASQSPRYISIQQARAIVAAIPPFITTVGVFVNPSIEEVTELLKQLPLDLLQFHGAETPEFCASFKRPYIKTIHMHENVDLMSLSQEYSNAQALLLETHTTTAVGGTGQTFDWQRIPKNLAKPIILAGGLNPENVGEAIRIAHPFAVDVCSGVELSKGKKDYAKLVKFIERVHDADR